MLPYAADEFTAGFRDEAVLVSQRLRLKGILFLQLGPRRQAILRRHLLAPFSNKIS